MKLTIILTVYNKEQYLQRALEALLNQQYIHEDDYELLAVNDGSTDGSAVILEKYAQRDARVRILTQQNQGLSMARNNGVKAAQGEYVWFVDADDVVSSKSVQSICEAMKSKPDIIPIYAKTEGIEKVRNKIPETVRSGKDILCSMKWEACGVFNVFRRTFLIENGLSFVPGIYHEDAEFTPRMLYAAKTVRVVPEILYEVIREPNSITQVPRAKRAFDYLIVAENLNHFIEEKGEMGTRIGWVFDYRIAMAINEALNVIVSNSKEEQSRFNMALDSKRQLIRTLKDSRVLKYRIEALLFRLFPGQYTIIYRLLKLLGR